jgi:hypothetical protein
MRRRCSICLICLAAACLPTACSEQGTWTQVAADAPEYARQREVASSASGQLVSHLMGELSGALMHGGAQKAIAVCGERASALASEVGSEWKVHIGRTSQRLRNPLNDPPAWAAAHVASAATEPAFFAGPSRQFGALYPIRLVPMCVQCHGRSEDLAPQVRAALQQNYPDDAATGFATGDLRGWLWVEVP